MLTVTDVHIFTSSVSFCEGVTAALQAPLITASYAACLQNKTTNQQSNTCLQRTIASQNNNILTNMNYVHELRHK